MTVPLTDARSLPDALDTELWTESDDVISVFVVKVAGESSTGALCARAGTRAAPAKTARHARLHRQELVICIQETW